MALNGVLGHLPLPGTVRRPAAEDPCGRSITLAVPFLDAEYFGELAAAVVLEGADHGYDVLVQQTGARRESELRVLRHSAHGASCGLVIQSLSLETEDVAALAGGHPLVVLGEQVVDGPVDHVTTPDAEAAEAAVAHLVSTGRRRIAAVGPHSSPSPVSAAVRRAEGYRTGLQSAGIAVDPALLVDVRGWGTDDGAAAVDRLLQAGTPFDAVFAFSDSLATGVLHALARRGLAVPGAVAVVGFDDVRSAGTTHPRLTTVDAGIRAVAHSAVSLLDERIRGACTGGPRRYTTLHRLVVREST